MELRHYQKEAVLSIINAWRSGETPYCNLMTGTGKSLILAEICRRSINQGYRVLQLVPTKELCQQNYQELINHCGNGDYGMVCSQLGKSKGNAQVVVAMTDSFLTKRTKFGKFDILLIDECDLVSYDKKSKYRKIIDSLFWNNPTLKIAGVTGSPYRMGTGLLENPHPTHGKSIFTTRAYCTDSIISDLIHKGYLSDIESISGDVQADLSNVTLNSVGEYNTELMAAKFNDIIPHAVRDMTLKISSYNMETVLIFASNIANAELIIDEYKQVTGMDNIRLVTGESSRKSERDKNIKWFSESYGQRILVNVGILTRGYNYRQLSCIVFMRATQSLSLYIQVIGRVIRSHEEKDKGYVIDYGGNIDRHGAIDNIKPPAPKQKKGDAPRKECYSIADQLLVKEIKEVSYTLVPGHPCGFINHASAKFCELCGSEFIPDPDAPGKYSMRSHAEILLAKEKAKEKHYDVSEVYVDQHPSKDGLMMLKIKFYNDDKNIHNQFLSLDKHGYPRQCAIKFLKAWAKSESDIIELHQDDMLNTKCMLDLLADKETLDRYFKTIKSITLKSKPDSKYKELKQVEFA